MAEAQDKKEEETTDDFPVEDKPAEDKPKKKFERGPPLEWPGDGLPTKPTSSIVFKWNTAFTSKIKCDTLHTLLLLQTALESIRIRTNCRNNWFKNHGRADRYRRHLDAPGIITQFLDWLNADRENHAFDGVSLDKAEKMALIRLFCQITGLKLGPATDIWQKLMVDIEVEERKSSNERPNYKLEVITYGYTKVYQAEKVIEECSTQEMAILLAFEGKGDVDDDGNAIQGIMEVHVAQQKKKGKDSQLQLTDNWQQRLVDAFIQNEIDGATLLGVTQKKLCQQIMDSIIPPDTLDQNGKAIKNTKLRGGIMGILRLLKKCYVHRILMAHAKQNQ
eukprot:209934_1